MKKICFILTAEFAVKAFMLNHLRALSKYYQVTVFVNTNNPELLADSGINARIVPIKIAREISLIKDSICLLKLIKIFYLNKFSAVHSITPKAGLLGIVAAWLTRVPLRIHTFQGEVWVTKKGFIRYLLIFFDKLVSYLSTHQIVVSKSEQEFLIKNKIISPQRSIVFCHGSISGVNLDKFNFSQDARNSIRKMLQISEEDIVVLYIGRLNLDKGLLDLVNAVMKIDSKILHLLIVGPDEHDLIAQIKNMICKYNINIHFHPHTDHPENFMSASDIISLPSYREGFGMVIVEAAAVGVPAIASRIYGIVDALVDYKTGILHEPHDIDDLSSKLKLLINNKQLRSELGCNARLRAMKDFDSIMLTEAWVDFYKRNLK